MKIAPVSADLLIKLAVVAAGLGAIWYVLGRAKTATSEAAQAAAAWVGETADNIISEPVYSAGDFLGVPRTSLTQCEIDKANGDTWAASFSCPLSEFASYLTTKPPRNTGGATGSW